MEEEKKVEEQTTEKDVQEVATEEKKFTQSEFQDALAKEVARKTKNIPSKEELKAFNEWKESQKTVEQKENEKDIEIARLRKENLEYKNMSYIANAGIDTKFQRFVLSEVIDMEGDFEENLETYIKENKQFLKQAEVKETKTTGFEQTNSNNKVSEEKSYLDKKYANNPYYKK